MLNKCFHAVITVLLNATESLHVTGKPKNALQTDPIWNNKVLKIIQNTLDCWTSSKTEVQNVTLVKS